MKITTKIAIIIIIKIMIIATIILVLGLLSGRQSWELLRDLCLD